MKIRMEHPDLPGQPIHARPGQVAARRRSGWREAPEPEPQTPAEQPEPKPSRRRRAAVTIEEESHGADAD